MQKNKLRSIPIFIFLITIISRSVLAQQTEPAFEQEFYESFHTKPKLDVKFDNRFSFIRDNDVKTLGLKVGLSFNRKFKLGLGINDMLTATDKKVNINDTSLNVNLEYFYFSPYFEYVFYNSRKWEFSLATQLGFGNASYEYYNLNNEKKVLTKTTVLSYEPPMLIHY